MRPWLVALLQLTVASACMLPCAAAAAGSRDIARWMHTSSGVRKISWFLETLTRKDGRYYYRSGQALGRQ
jgi:hypothetical protein